MKKIVRNHWRAMKIWWSMDPQLILSGILYAVLSALSPLSTIYLSARLVAELAGTRAPDRLRKWVILILAVQGAVQLLLALCRRWRDSHTAVCDMRRWEPFNNKLARMDYCQRERQCVSDLMYQIRQNENIGGWGFAMVPSVLNAQLLPGVFSFFGGIALSVTLFTAQVDEGSRLSILNSPVLAVVVLAVLLCAAALAAWLQERSDQGFADYAPKGKLGNRIFSFFLEVGQDRARALDVRLYEQQSGVLSPMFLRDDAFSAKGDFGKLMFGRVGLLSGLCAAVTALLTGLIYLFVCLKAWGGAFGVGEITQYVGAVTQCFLGVNQLMKGFGTMKVNTAFLDPALELLDIPNRMYQGSLTTEKRADRQYQIEFRDVSFRYPDTDTDVLHHVNLTFQVGSRLAVVGQNGSGKTTFIKLLCRLYDPTEGQILLNGIDIRKYSYAEYMDIFSVVFQDYKLFPLPLGQNVGCAVDYDRLRAAQCLADAGFPEKYDLDTVLYKVLDESGVEISGGEAQKAAIARALYKDAPFIILDEPTAALDPIAEAEIYEKFDRIVTDKTAVYISHRLSSCKFCDQIAVFDGGTIMQLGTHAQLLAEEGGKYHALWTAQAQYYTE